MKNTKNELIQIRLTELEKEVIKGKAEFLGLSVSDYIREVCVFDNISNRFMRRLHAASIQNKGEEI